MAIAYFDEAFGVWCMVHNIITMIPKNHLCCFLELDITELCSMHETDLMFPFQLESTNILYYLQCGIELNTNTAFAGEEE